MSDHLFGVWVAEVTAALVVSTAKLARQVKCSHSFHIPDPLTGPGVEYCATLLRLWQLCCLETPTCFSPRASFWPLTLGVAVGHAALDAVIANYPDQRFTLRNGILVIPRALKPQKS